jgi:hypothetical protein
MYLAQETATDAAREKRIRFVQARRCNCDGAVEGRLAEAPFFSDSCALTSWGSEDTQGTAESNSQAREDDMLSTSSTQSKNTGATSKYNTSPCDCSCQAIARHGRPDTRTNTQGEWRLQC